MAVLAMAACPGVLGLRGELLAADVGRPSELVASRQCDRCGFGTVRLDMPRSPRSISVGYLTDEQLAKISAFLRVAKRNAANRWLESADDVRSLRTGSVAHKEATTAGESDESQPMTDTGAAIVDAMTRGGVLDGSATSITLGPSSLQFRSVDDGGWISLTLTTPQFAFRSVHSP